MEDGILKYKDNSYVVRDTFKSKEYFLKQLEKINKCIDKYKTYLENGMVKDIHFYYICIANNLLEKIRIFQTLGENRENIKSLVEEYCDAIEKKKADLTYNEVENTLSLAYLYNLNIKK